jgi:hypothetical protein
MPSSVSSIGNSASGSLSNDPQSRSNLLLSQAAQGHKDAFEELRDGAAQFAPHEAMGLLQRMAHPDPGDPVAASHSDATWTSDQKKELISAFQTQSRQEPIQHLNVYFGELAKVSKDKQSKSDEFSELKHTINHLSKPDALKFLVDLDGSSHPDLNADALRELKEGIQGRADMYVKGAKGEPQELKDAGEIGAKHKFLNHNPTAPTAADADANKAVASPLNVSYGEGRRIFERGSYLNLSSRQVDKKIGPSTTIENRTRMAELGVRAYMVTGSSIDPEKMANANQSFNVGAQAQGNLVHSTYAIKYEPEGLSLGNKEVLKPKVEGTVDCRVSHNGDVRAGFSAGEYPAVQIQGSAFLGARAEAQGKAKVSVFAHDALELKGKVNISASAEAGGAVNVGRVYDTIEGHVIRTGVELGGAAFVGLRGGGEVGGDLAGVGGKVKAEGWLGIGVLSKIYLKSQNGTLSFGGEHGVALGLGGSVSWGVSVNPGKLAKTVNKDLPHKIEASILAAPGAVGRKMASGATAVGKGLLTAGTAARNGAQMAGMVAANSAAAAGAGVQSAAAMLQSSESAASTQARAIGTSLREGVRSGARVTGNVAANMAGTVGAGARNAAAALRSGANAVSTGAQNLVDNGRQFNAALRARILQGSHGNSGSAPQLQAPQRPDEMAAINETEEG